MPLVGPPEERETQAAAQVVDEWIEGAREVGGLLVAAEREDVTDRTAERRWYLRFAGEEKEFITVWLTLRQRTLHHEAQFMPAPEENAAEVYAYLLRRNADLLGMSFSLGAEDAVYLNGRIPAGSVTDLELDRIAGASVHYVDEFFPTAMTLGHPSLYRRRRSRGRRPPTRD